MGLALATASKRPGEFTPVFIETLKLLTPDDAAFIRVLHKEFPLEVNVFVSFPGDDLSEITKMDYEQLDRLLESLERVGILKTDLEIASFQGSITATYVPDVKINGHIYPNYIPSKAPDYQLRIGGRYITRYGEQFISACLGAGPYTATVEQAATL